MVPPLVSRWQPDQSGMVGAILCLCAYAHAAYMRLGEKHFLPVADFEEVGSVICPVTSIGIIAEN